MQLSNKRLIKCFIIQSTTPNLLLFVYFPHLTEIDNNLIWRKICIAVTVNFLRVIADKQRLIRCENVTKCDDVTKFHS